MFIPARLRHSGGCLISVFCVQSLERRLHRCDRFSLKEPEHRFALSSTGGQWLDRLVFFFIHKPASGRTGLHKPACPVYRYAGSRQVSSNFLFVLTCLLASRFVSIWLRRTRTVRSVVDSLLQIVLCGL